ncbi:hypothetical protein SAMN05660772_00912 [Pasteurella testudinis DSM 23072]|uniref:Uncharacterized protein n=1 Tax=Pasteurella testudinis DSM 23072 TaxID=1122938 RepID=A0A1W1V012_9PAST|nr:hypothetical protein SAMN05660772_00912 [Pasteurella testudinis DSM 23072]SUB51831.1 Uncharacterised protein [Pasteurella testudinis]
MIRVDNGSEMTSFTFTHWCEANNITICYIVSLASRTKTPISSDLIAAIVQKFSPHICSPS